MPRTLRKGGVGGFLRRITPFLKQQGVTLWQVEDDYPDVGYWVTVNGYLYEIYTPAHDSYLTWGLSMARAFAIVNGLLLQADSEERLYAVYGGNELLGFFLTPALLQVICSHPDATPRDRPYVPTAEPPWFGQEPW